MGLAERDYMKYDYYENGNGYYGERPKKKRNPKRWILFFLAIVFPILVSLIRFYKMHAPGEVRAYIINTKDIALISQRISQSTPKSELAQIEQEIDYIREAVIKYDCKKVKELSTVDKSLLNKYSELVFFLKNYEMSDIKSNNLFTTIYNESVMLYIEHRQILINILEENNIPYEIIEDYLIIHSNKQYAEDNNLMDSLTNRINIFKSGK